MQLCCSKSFVPGLTPLPATDGFVEARRSESLVVSSGCSMMTNERDKYREGDQLRERIIHSSDTDLSLLTNTPDSKDLCEGRARQHL